MADINQFIDTQKEFISTFKDTSYDNNNRVFICRDETQTVLNFDAMIEAKYPDSNSRPKSFDAIYINDKRIYGIEFKNQKPSQLAKNKADLKEKFLKGSQELAFYLSENNISIKDYDFICCVAYKNCIEQKDRYKFGIAKNTVQFGLKSLKNEKWISKIYTAPVSFFTKEIRKLNGVPLNC